MATSDEKKIKSKLCYDKVINYFKDADYINQVHIRLHSQFVVVSLGYINIDSLYLHMIFYMHSERLSIQIYSRQDKIDINYEKLDELYNEDSLFQLSTIYDVSGLIKIYTKFNSLTSLVDDLAAIRDAAYYEN